MRLQLYIIRNEISDNNTLAKQILCMQIGKQ